MMTGAREAKKNKQQQSGFRRGCRSSWPWNVEQSELELAIDDCDLLRAFWEFQSKQALEALDWLLMEWVIVRVMRDLRCLKSLFC